MKYKSVLAVILIALLTKFTVAQVFNPQFAIGGDTCIFDIQCERIIIDTSQSNNIWQIGKPGKTVFDMAYIDIRAIITDSSDVYDTNNISSFTLQLVHPGTRMHEIIFWHQYETDEGKDGGYIEMSYDMGETWTNILDYMNYPLAYQTLHRRELYNAEDSIAGGNIGYNGSSNGWVKSSISWNAITISGEPIDERVNQDTTLLRFTFISDSVQDNLDGWCIDNIIHLLYETPDALKSMQQEPSVILYPNPGCDMIHVESQIPLSTIEIYNMVGRRIVRIDSPSDDIPISSLPRGIYNVILYSENQIIINKKLTIL